MVHTRGVWRWLRGVLEGLRKVGEDEEEEE
jgi:hypothetical protein